MRLPVSLDAKCDLCGEGFLDEQKVLVLDLNEYFVSGRVFRQDFPSAQSLMEKLQLHKQCVADGFEALRPLLASLRKFKAVGISK